MSRRETNGIEYERAGIILSICTYTHLPSRRHSMQQKSPPPPFSPLLWSILLWAPLCPHRHSTTKSRGPGRSGQGEDRIYRPGDFARTAAGLPAFPRLFLRPISQRHGNAAGGRRIRAKQR